MTRPMGDEMTYSPGPVRGCCFRFLHHPAAIADPTMMERSVGTDHRGLIYVTPPMAVDDLGGKLAGRVLAINWLILGGTMAQSWRKIGGNFAGLWQ